MSARSVLAGVVSKRLAQHSGIDPHTISRFERDRSNPRKVTMDSLQHTFEMAGVVFSPELPGAQVRRNHQGARATAPSPGRKAGAGMSVKLKMRVELPCIA